LAEEIALPAGVPGPELVAPFAFEAAVWAGVRVGGVFVFMPSSFTPRIVVWEGRSGRVGSRT
jgi:hypothetical protein